MKYKLIYIIIIISGTLSPILLKSQIAPSNNFIGVDVSTFPQNASFNYDSCFYLGKDLGMSRVGVFQNWTSIETAPSVFNLTLFDIANYYYPLHSMPIDITIAPISTNNLEVPSDLVSITFDNPVLINRFKILLDSIKIHIPNITVSSLVIGSEHDVYFGGNVTLWSQYTTFYNAILSYAKTLWPGIKVATELTFDGITGYNASAQILNTNSDYVGVSYYPLNSNFTVKPVSTIPTDFSNLVSLYPSKPIYFYQYGYPSSVSCNSSETQQAQFITQTFTSWDTYASNIKMIDFTWLHDLDTAAVNYYETYYGISDTVFLEYLHTIGLRTWNGNGTDKAAFTELQCQAKQRGYNSLPTSCTSGLSEIKNEIGGISIFPNPAQDIINIEISDDFTDPEIIIYNELGQIQKFDFTINNKTITFEIAKLKNGIYFIIVQKGYEQIKAKFLIMKT